MKPKRNDQRKTAGADLNRREMIKGMVGLLAAGAGSASAQATREPPASTSTSNSDSKTMAERAELCQAQVLEVARGPGGLIISHCQFDTRLPVQEGDVPLSMEHSTEKQWGPDSPPP